MSSGSAGPSRPRTSSFVDAAAGGVPPGPGAPAPPGPPLGARAGRQGGGGGARAGGGRRRRALPAGPETRPGQREGEHGGGHAWPGPGAPPGGLLLGYQGHRNGSFGVVYQARLADSGELVAIKKVLQDKRFKNRELQIMRKLDHGNIVRLRYYFYSSGGEEGRGVPEPGAGLCARDGVPRGTPLHQGQADHPRHLCQGVHVPALPQPGLHPFPGCLSPRHQTPEPSGGPRHSRAQAVRLRQCQAAGAGRTQRLLHLLPLLPRPELIFGATDYTSNIDIWSAGCVLAELLLGQPIFPGDSGVDQLVEIIKVLGTPTREQIREMNPNYTEFKFPQIKAHPWLKVFKPRTPVEAISLCSRLLEYTPATRLSPLEACTNAFFNELREPTARLPSGRDLPPLFNFSPVELAIEPSLKPLPHPAPPTGPDQLAGVCAWHPCHTWR
ncbi:unnamed protein product [Eretmochelys imbricata]